MKKFWDEKRSYPYRAWLRADVGVSKSVHAQSWVRIGSAWRHRAFCDMRLPLLVGSDSSDPADLCTSCLYLLRKIGLVE